MTVCDPSLYSTDSRYSVVKHRIVDHVKCLNPKTGRTELGEMLECISIRKYQPKSVSYVSKQVVEYVPKWTYV